MRRLIGLVLIDAAFIGVMAFLAPGFVSRTNMVTMIGNMSFEAIALAGLTMLLVGGLFDLSIDGVVAVAGVICGKLLMDGAPVLAAIAAGMAVGLGIGLVNGLLVMKVKVNPIISTLGTWWICAGMAYGITKAISPYGFPSMFHALGQTQILGLKVYVFYAVVIVGVLAAVLALTKFGRHVYIIGGNREAGRLFGVRIERMGITLYLLMAALAAFIGIIMAARLDAGAANVVDGMTMRVLAAAVIGGCALSGGKGNILSGLLGLLLLNMLTNAAIILGLSPYWQKSIIGVVLLLALIADALSSRIHVPHLARKTMEADSEAV
jgi:ribose transport system permease protein